MLCRRSETIQKSITKHPSIQMLIALSIIKLWHNMIPFLDKQPSAKLYFNSTYECVSCKRRRIKP